MGVNPTAATVTDLDVRITVAMDGDELATIGVAAPLFRDAIRHALAEVIAENLEGATLGLGLGHVEEDGTASEALGVARVDVLDVSPVCRPCPGRS